MRKKILVVAAHPDDELLGCGGAILYHLNRGDKIRIIIVAEGLTSRDSKRDKVTRFNDLNKLKSTTIKIFKKIGVREVDFLDFADNRLDSYNLIDVIKPIEKIIQNYKPNVIYTHNPGDLNIDHNIVNRAVMTASRPKPKISIEKIYAFEVLSSTNWSINHTNSNFEPNYFLNIAFTEIVVAIVRWNKSYDYWKTVGYILYLMISKNNLSTKPLRHVCPHQNKIY